IEAMERGQRPRRIDLENRAVRRGAAIECRPVEAAVARLNQPAGILRVAGVEAVKRRQHPRRRVLENRAVARRAASGCGAVEAAIAPLDKSTIGIRTPRRGRVERGHDLIRRLTVGVRSEAANGNKYSERYAPTGAEMPATVRHETLSRSRRGGANRGTPVALGGRIASEKSAAASR